jgi:3-phenylpropionate/trans-cinnamate dioxygenase ferredoxin reductase subunit
MRTDVLLIGGGIAATSAAAELREQGFDGSVLLVTRELEPPYHRPPVTKELLVGARARDEVRIRPDDWWESESVELRTRSAVMTLDAEARTATLASKEEIEFGQALIATGAMVRRLGVEGAQLEGIHYLRAPGNAEALRKELDGVERVAIVGGSFIATEVAASLTALGKQCTLIMQEQAPLERVFGRFAGAYVSGLLTSHGVRVHGGQDVVAFEGHGRVDAVRTASGLRVPADLVVIGAGAVPDVALARRAGLELGETGGIRCDAGLLTSAAGIFAAGDVCEYDSVVHGRRLRVEHEDHAGEQGRTVARNLLGAGAPHAVVPYFWSDLSDWATLESVGPAESWDEELLTGDLGDHEFTLWYLSAGTIVAAITVGRPSDLDAARRLIADRGGAARLRELGIVASRVSPD